MKPDVSSRIGRSVAPLTIGVWMVSMIFPIAASLLPAERRPVWIGGLDVMVAVVLILLSLVMDGAGRGKIDSTIVHASYRLYRLFSNSLLLFLVIFFVFGERIDWSVLLPGLAWRAWVLVYAIPTGLAIWKSSQGR